MTLYGIECALALLAMLLTAGLWCRRNHIGYGVWIRLCVFAIPLALIGSRLFFGLTSLGMGDMTSPLQILYAWDGGASIAGAFAGIMLATFIAAKSTKTSFAALTDGLALGSPLAILIARLSEAPLELMGKGRYVDTEWLSFLGAFTDECHPVFLYEALWAAVIGIALFFYVKMARRSGDIMLTFMTLYGCAQMLFESLRDDGHMIIYYIRINQLTSLAMVLIAFVIWLIRFARNGGKRGPIIARCAVLAVAIALCIYQEFQVDSNDNLLLEYALMAAGLAVMGAMTLLNRRSAQ